MLRAGKTGPTPFLSFPYGSGRITLISDIDFWKNKKIAENDNAAFLWQTVTLAGDWDIDRVIFIRSAGLSFAALLWHNGWMAIVATAVFLGLWLWKCFVRNGPIRQPPEGSERQFLSHVQMGGRLLWRHRQGDVLLDAVRDEIRETVIRRHFQGGNPREERINDFLAERSGLAVDKIRRAMTPSRIDKGNDMIDITRDLQLIHSRL
jgi:hypothetical protein